MADLPGINVASTIRPFTTDDTYATHEAKYGKGGFITVDTWADMQAITAARREVGMYVNVVNDPDPNNNVTWELTASGFEKRIVFTQPPVSNSWFLDPVFKYGGRLKLLLFGDDVFLLPLPPGKEAEVAVEEDTGNHIYVVNTFAKHITDYYERIFNKGLRFTHDITCQQILGLCLYDILGELQYRNESGVRFIFDDETVKFSPNKEFSVELVVTPLDIQLRSNDNNFTFAEDSFELILNKGKFIVAKQGAINVSGDLTSSVIENTYVVDVPGLLEYKGNGTILGMDEDGPIVKAREIVTGTEYQVWHHPDGTLRVPFDRAYYTGEPSYRGQVRLADMSGSETPLFFEYTPGIAESSRLFNSCPSIIFIPRPEGGGRFIAGYMGDCIIQSESMNNYLVFKYSDDYGDTWTECFYCGVFPSKVVRPGSVHFIYDPYIKALHIYFGADKFEPSYHQSWMITVRNPLENKGFNVTTPWRFFTHGYSSFPFMVDNRLYICSELPNHTAEMLDYRGKFIYEIDVAKRTATMVEKLPMASDITDYDWPETSCQQIKNGGVVAIFRTLVGQYITRNLDGLMRNWTEPVSLNPIAGDTTASRTLLTISPKGNYYFCYNNSTARRDLTLAKFNDDFTAFEFKVNIDQPPVSTGLRLTTTYPSITYDALGNIIVIYDRARVAYGEIWISIINEEEMLLNKENTNVVFKQLDVNITIPKVAYSFTTGPYYKGFEYRNPVITSINDVFSCTRNSNAYRYNEAGVYQTLANNEPVLNYNPLTRVKIGLLIEPAITNALPYSNQFDQWTQNRVTITPNSSYTVDGSMTADRVVENSIGGSHYVERKFTDILDLTKTYFFKVKVKASGKSRIQITSGNTNFGVKYVNFDLSTETITQNTGGIDPYIKNVGGDTYEISAGFTPLVIGEGIFAIALISTPTGGRLESYTGDGMSGVFLSHGEVNVGVRSEVHIPTLTTAVTKDADVIEATLEDLSFSTIRGTFIIDHSVPAGGVVLTSNGTDFLISQGPGRLVYSYQNGIGYVSHQNSAYVVGVAPNFVDKVQLFRNSQGYLYKFMYYARYMTNSQAFTADYQLP